VPRILYFAYGSNLDVEQMEVRCPGSRPLVRARLHDHRLAFTHLSRRWGGGAADIVPEQGESVWGALYELDREHLESLDRFEGGYDSLVVRVDSEGAAPYSARTYTVRVKGEYSPTEEYLQKMLRWGSRWGLPESYLSRLRSFAGPEPV
jgi:gamma-glutamylcyclotransferase (GGCT)/AIG2-like uncharacterized protein YtfP